MLKEKSPHILFFCSLITLAMAVLQYLNPAFSFFDGGLILVVLLTVLLKKKHYTGLFGATGIALIIVACFYHSESADRRQLIVQHLFSLIIIVLATFFVLYVKKLYRSIESDQHQVNALFETARKVSEQELLNRQQQLEKITEEMRHLNTDLEAKVEQRTAILREALRELEKSQEELSEALSKEKELGEIKSRFVSMASHEFRTPLSTILSSATLLSRYTATEDQGKRDKHIKRIRDAVKHLDVLLEDFLSVGMLEEGKIRAEPAPFPISDLLEEVTEEMQSLAKPGQTIDCQYSSDQILTTDNRLVKNILINLLSNAIKFSAEGASIELRAHSLPAGGVVLSVRDKGIGITVADQQHLFSSFFRGANAVNIEGTGLGLHIVQRYLELLHGHINLESVLGEGTLATVEIPPL